MTVDIRRQRNGFLIPQVGDESVRAVFLHKPEAVGRIHVCKAGGRISVGFVAVLIYDHAGIQRDFTMLFATDLQSQIAEILHHKQIPAAIERVTVNADHAVGNDDAR